MNYIHNIYLNFNNEYYDFYEWVDNDNIIHLNKIPIIKVPSNKLKEILTNKILIDNELYNKIYNKSKSNYNKYKTSLLITDNKDIIALSFDKNKISTHISSLVLSDELDILNEINNMKEYNLKYKIISKRKYITDTRNELKMKRYILKNIKYISYDRLKYIYYDCFNKEENNYNNMLNKIINNLNINNKLVSKIYNTLNPISTN
jgi:hypothetical protein